MAISFTPEQERVIQLHNRNILVSAAAGSGKTAVLVERIVRMVCDEVRPVDIDRLLIVTFTNAAASEMRERIAMGIAQRLKECPESEHIQRQSTLLHNAQITTIDSFCLFIIRNHFHEIGLDPAFRVADENEIKLLEQEILGELLEESYQKGREDFLNCVEFFCPSGREGVLEEDILRMSHQAASCPFPEEWLTARKQDYSAQTAEELLGGAVGAYLKRYVDAMLDGCIQKLTVVQRLCESPDGPYMYGELVESELEAIEAIRQYDSLTEYSVRIPAVSFGRLSSKRDESVSPAKRELAKNLRTQVKDLLDGVSESFFGTPLPLAAAQSKECERAVNELLDLTLEFDRRMRQRKREQKMIDFSDMEHYALDILLERDGGEVRPGRVAREYREYFQEILIDEYQDSNLVQEYLLKAISGEEDGSFNRFMVGDVKQSIYRFRLARPELFMEKYDSYQEDGEAYCRIDLSRNFRSRSQVVDTVNSVFGRIMSREVGGIAYDDRAALYAGAEYPEAEGCESELLLVEKPQKDEELDAKQAEGLVIAERIKELKRSFQVFDRESGGPRPVRYSDMVILLRANSGWDEEFKAVLEQEGIPAYITSKTGYFAATEVQELLQVLRVLDNPRQDIPLYGMLKSIFGGFTEEEIALIRAGGKGCSLYEALCKWEHNELQAHEDSDSTEQGIGAVSRDGEAVGEGDFAGHGIEKAFQDEGLGNREAVDLGAKVAAFLHRLREYRACTVYMPIRELLQRVVEDYDYMNYVTALPAGSRRRANVEMLFHKASDFEKTSYFGLFHFVRYIEQLERYDVDYGEADLLDENADVVRIMSIHKSKGLEFPVTFVAGLSKRFNMQDYNRAMIMDMDMGLGVTYVNPRRRIRNRTLRQNVIAKKLREENLAEELRVLYVAMTRAREKLIMTAAVDKAGEKWEFAQEYQEEKLAYPDFMEAGSYVDFLMPILAGAGFKVSVLGQETLAGHELVEQFDLAGRREELRYAADYANRETEKTLRSRLAFVYPYQSLEKLYTKTTVSELKVAAMAQKDEAAFHAFEEREIVPYIPVFRRDKEKVSGTVRGNAFHRAMELLDFDGLLGGQFAEAPSDYDAYRRGLDTRRLRTELQGFLERETLSLRLSREYLDALNIGKLIHFMESELSYRMWRAQLRGELYREQPFVLGIDAGRVSEEFPEQEKVLIQGIIDVFWVEAGELVLLDYKTDVIGSMEELWNRYEVQIAYYQEALEKLMRMPVKESILYSFYLETGAR
ncbi:MAG: UvrD-helicase domain-containing protein [Butyrivibrio sp.]|nr:UvrD-helicase domain-containing protein [Muribaculum sp.]MCM1552618.1 UvrD-helicase domain-containing protein [Butyrivibrio sp.]